MKSKENEIKGGGEGRTGEQGRRGGRSAPALDSQGERASSHRPAKGVQMNDQENEIILPHRRDFLQLLGVGTTLARWSNPGFVAGPFAAEEAGTLVPLDKKLSPEWVRHPDRPRRAGSLSRRRNRR